MNTFRKFAVIFMLGMLAMMPMEVAASSLSSNTASVALSMSVSETLSVGATPANISFTYTSAGGGTATASGPITVTTTWTLAPTRINIMTAAYFASASAALTNGTINIPVSEVYSSNNGGAVAPCTGFAETGLAVDGQTCNNASVVYWSGSTIGNFNSSATSTVLLSMQGLGTLPYSTFTGTLFIAAMAN